MPLTDTVIKLDTWKKVVCDICFTEWTNNPKAGGFLFGAKAVCPDCEKPFKAQIKRHGEDRYIRSYCPDDMSFHEWVLWIRWKSTDIDPNHKTRPGRIS